MFRKKFWSLLLILSMVALVFSAGTAFGGMETITGEGPLPQPRVVTDRPLNVAYGLLFLTSESCQRDWAQIQIEAEHRGWNLTHVVDAATTDAQRNAMETFIHKDVDAIIINYFRMEPLRDLILQARNKGIGIYCVDTELRPGVILDTTQPNGVVGAQVFYYGLDRLGGRGKMLILNYTDHVLRRRCYAAQGLVENDWPALELVGFENLPMPGFEKASFDYASNYITKYGDELSWIFGGWDTPGIFAARAVEQAGYTRDDIFCTGIDGGSEAYAEIRKGSPFIATMSQPFEEYVHVLCDAIEQIQIEGIGIGEPGSMIPDSRTIYCPPVITTPENCPPAGSSIHEVFASTYYDPEDKDAWYFWAEAYKLK